MMRYERKYRIEDQTYEQVRIEILSIVGAFAESYPDRWVNSIYLDSTGFSALRENQSGVSNRSKYRLRWYGDLYEDILTPILEEKVKNNVLGYKNTWKLPSTSLSPDNLRTSLDLSQIRDMDIQPVAMIRYLRTYLESFDHRVRITIDRRLQYRGINNYEVDPYPTRDDAIVLEIKYDQRIEHEIDDILQSIKYRLTKNSKFVSGVMSYWG